MNKNLNENKNNQPIYKKACVWGVTILAVFVLIDVS